MPAGRIDSAARRPSSWTMAAAVVAAGLALAAFAAFRPVWATDTICRYAPMAEAFAAGEWAEAFHPRFGVAMSVLAGVCRFVFPVDGLSACAAVSTFTWALCALPLFWIARRVFDSRVAVFAAILYLLSPTTLVWALQGMREPLKILGVLLAADALLECRDGGWGAAAKASVGTLLLFTAKCDSVALGGASAVAFAAVDGFRRRGWAVLASGALAAQPMCALVFDWTGWWLPAPQYVTMIRRLLGA